jgi:hypothetical protein
LQKPSASRLLCRTAGKAVFFVIKPRPLVAEWVNTPPDRNDLLNGSDIPATTGRGFM